MGADVLGYAYAATLIIGGIMGYVKAQSIPSLAAGLIFGTLIGYGAYQISQNANDVSLSLGVSVFLTCLMTYRFITTGKNLPAIVACISLVNALRLLYRFFNPVEVPGISQKPIIIKQ